MQKTEVLENKINKVGKSLSQLRIKKRGFIVSSFSGISSMKEEKNAIGRTNEAVKDLSFRIRTDSELNDLREDDEHNNKEIQKIEDEFNYFSSITKNNLPGGTQTGNMMHELLEYLDFEKIRRGNNNITVG